MSTKYIYLDCDDVLLDTTRVFMDFMHSDYGVFGDENKYPSEWDISSTPFADFNSAVEVFARSNYYKKITPMLGAQKGVQQLKNNGYKIFVVSSCPNNETAITHRQYCLHNCFGDVFEDIVCLSFGFNNKGKYFEMVPRGIVVDDAIFNVTTAMKHGHDAILMAVAQNLDWQHEARNKKIPVMSSLEEVAQFLLEK